MRQQAACIEGNKQIYKRKLLAAAPTCVAIAKQPNPTLAAKTSVWTATAKQAGDGFYCIIPSQYLGSAALA